MMEPEVDELIDQLAELIRKKRGNNRKDELVEVFLALFSRARMPVYSALAVLAVAQSFLYKQIWESAAEKRRRKYVA